ncbi:Flagellar biosynthesis/type III secretory pathway chaperone [Clostridium acidisoli DSM 12555]|uniref:Flagellar biosynthesis/type III secretory pathway chaperone n=1 Tax=Clostridium acidisoli DSM 12555 TaxID=1121291 RepID=A0A1W1X1V9_9CLOT|nr:flagellar protein FlgN [Clostridium acidisoli]SMC17946.1 Flagellar biosynthesis/type III secretory pathway chaperone [Clostridium acidisoli DSM 12555]
MMIALNDVMKSEFDSLGELLVVLKEQHNAYIKKDLFALEGIVKKIENINGKVAKFEVERRKLVKDKSMKVLIKEFNNEELEQNFNNVSNILKEVKSQKETNEFLIKQGLMFTNRMLNIFRPSKVAKTYNNFGKMRK